MDLEKISEMVGAGQQVQWFTVEKKNFTAHFGAPRGTLMANFQTKPGTTFDSLRKAIVKVYASLNSRTEFEVDEETAALTLVVKVPGVTKLDEIEPYVVRGLEIIDRALDS